MKKIKQLVLASAVLATPFLAHADMKSLDDAALSGVTGQDGISIAGTFNAQIGKITYEDTDASGGSLVLDGIHLPSVTIADNAPLTVDVVTTSITPSGGGTAVATQQLQLGLPSITGNVKVDAVRVGETGASIGSLTVSNLNLAGSQVRIWGH
ncbi:DUF6160 family protein [Pseudomonas sp. ZM23]|uniref:DUF6160 family protein n=1 Tax=Pseudomonas triclosanedens TaxID=2961893 RepID=A0ABY7A4C7_9PSED|nr:DUF6160 family protein [Pseudomonas triclosanedens]MCP8465692.1 DUF6160 family protein [Pseudomonas triclosanedens]MCP8471187.1 DUF6160 family protein [Pseudomonas triclosanedens]MCP8476991.1 DUF6160 family protein [Pseudomonas triclosanedens]WAI51899.1 DUF6160 family protein [Pseudomonas triclosanedens]